MIHIKTNASKLIIIVHEIYGVNQHIDTVCHSLAEKGFDIICPNLLERNEPFHYSSEGVAYRYFMDQIGVPPAATKIKRIVRDMKGRYEKAFILGYSVGATIAWLCSTETTIDGMVGFYGSRIRNYLEIEPLCPTLLFFPEREKSFHVDELLPSLKKKKNVQILKMHGEHGFSDPYNAAYQEKSAQKSFDIMVDFLSNH